MVQLMLNQTSNCLFKQTQATSRSYYLQIISVTKNERQKKVVGTSVQARAGLYDFLLTFGNTYPEEYYTQTFLNPLGYIFFIEPIFRII